LTSDPNIQPLYSSASPDGQRIAATDIDRREVFIYDARDFSKPLKMFAPPLEPKNLPPRITDWSPDGRFLAITAQGASGIWIYSLSDGTTRRVADGTLGSWFKDGRRLAHIYNNRIWVFDFGSGKSSELLRVPGGTAGAGPRLAANDTQLFFLQTTASADVWVVRLRAPVEDSR
jgi:Tol biopolymer transport system component